MVESRQGLLTGDLSECAADIIGLGMHGSWTAIAITHMGIGKIRLWDFDTVGQENLETQAYRPADVGKPKTQALARILKLYGYEGNIEIKGEFDPNEADSFHPIVLCHADSMKARQDAARHAMLSDSKLFIETRSAGNDLFIHAFKPSKENVDHYIAGFFPEILQQVACGATGTIAIGMQAAAIIGGIISQSNAGENIDLLPNEHSVSLGMYHTAKPFKIEY